MTTEGITLNTAYREAVLQSEAKDVKALVSVVIDSAEPGPVHVRAWTDQMGGPLRNNLFGSFLAALELWKYVKDYDPRNVVQTLSPVQMN
jgi:hypothetical protein